MRVPATNKQQLLTEMLLDDLVSDHPSREARDVLEAMPDLIGRRNRDSLRVELTKQFLGKTINYAPPNLLVTKYLSDKRLGTAFFIPLIVNNSGKRVAHVSSLALVATPKEGSNKKWAFTAFVEVNSAKLWQRAKDVKDADLIEKLFTGFSVAPGESVRINPWFMAMHEARNQIISRESIIPGEYFMRIYGYGANGKRVLETLPITYRLTGESLISAFNGSESILYLDVEERLADATRVEQG